MREFEAAFWYREPHEDVPDRLRQAVDDERRRRKLRRLNGTEQYALGLLTTDVDKEGDVEEWPEPVAREFVVSHPLFNTFAVDQHPRLSKKGPTKWPFAEQLGRPIVNFSPRWRFFENRCIRQLFETYAEARGQVVE